MIKDDAKVVVGDCWLALVEGRGVSLCTEAAPAEEVVAFSALLYAPEYPSERH